MDIKRVGSMFGINDLKELLLNTIKTKRNDAELESDKYIDLVLSKLENDKADEEIKTLVLIVELNYFKKIIYYQESTEVSHFFKNYTSYKKKGLSFSKVESRDSDEVLVDYILDFFEFFSAYHYLTHNKLKKIIDEFLPYFTFEKIIKKSEVFLKKLNELNYLENFIWTLDNIEIGMSKFYEKILLKIIDINSENENNLKKLKFENDFEIKNLKYEIDSLTEEVRRKEGQIEFHIEYEKKYLYNSQRFIIYTFFGDNLPFLLNTYNFLVKYGLLINTGWSHFYTCMDINSKEIINLNNINRSKFVGRFFFNLRYFLIPEYKQEHQKFIKNKFYINENPINDYFFINHMRTIYDIDLNPELENVDDFFRDQRKIYLKSYK